jgi:hypothetical protein
MTVAAVLPTFGTVLVDGQRRARSLRVSWHPVEDLCVISIWQGATCEATFRLTREGAPALIGSLVDGLAQAPAPWSVANYTAVPSPTRRRIGKVLRSVRAARPHEKD